MNILKSQRIKRRRSVRRALPQSRPVPMQTVASVSVLMLAGVLNCRDGLAQTVVMPRIAHVGVVQTPTAPTNSVPGGTPNATGSNLAAGSTSANPVYTPTVQAGQFSPYTVNQTTNTATVTETSNSGILSWNSFNIGSGATVNIVQPSSTSTLLNLVNGPMAQSLIDGALNANGIVYLYNPSGIIFGKSAVVNVNSLFASTLAISNNQFLNGILSPVDGPVFAADPTLSTAPGSILVDGDSSSGAKLTAANGGKINLFAPNVTNNGVVTAPDGQVIMAGGGKVYLSAPTSTAMRGLYVEVDSSALPAGTTTSVTNNGSIAVGHGNATLIGLAVNQNGTVSAQTSVSLNGSIYLSATDGGSRSGATAAPTSSITGTLTLGSNSVTKVDIVDDGNTITQGPTDNPYNPSQITLTGQTINLLGNGQGGGAQVKANGGNVSVNAAMSLNFTGPDVSAVNLAPGSTIDVSGDTNAVLPMSSNVISVQLLGELADNLVLRNSTLRGATMNFDIRTGTTIADISADLAKIPYTIGQLASTGGTVNVSAGGSIVQQAGSTINVSGGQVNYAAGYVNTSQLVSGGALYSDATAPMNRTYTGFVNLPNGSWDYNPAYFDGKSAGTVSISAPAIVLQGQLKANTVEGQYQRNVDATNRPAGGQLIIGTAPASSDVVGVAAAYGDDDLIVLNNNSTMPAATDVATALASNRLDLNVDTMNTNGFTTLNLYTGNNVEIPGNLTLGAGGSINMNALGPITINGNINIPGGTLKGKSQDAVTLGAGVNVNLAGTWTNDLAASGATLDANGNPVGDIVLNGGNLSLNGADVVLNPGVSVDVSGGAWVSSSKKLTYGTGGNISLSANANAVNPNSLAPVVNIGYGVNLDSYGFFKGGTLSILSNSVEIGGTAMTSDGKSLWLPANYFDQGGFSTFNITSLTDLTVAPDSQISAIAQNWMFANVNQWRDVPSGSVASVAAPGTLNLVGPDSGRQPVNVSLSAVTTTTSQVSGTLTFGKGANLTTDPSATVSLTAGNLLNIDGTINAPSGTINLGLSTLDPTTIAYDPSRSIWIGPEAHLFAQGTTADLYTQHNGITTGQVLGGGTINIGGEVGSSSALQDVGYVVVAQQSFQGQTLGATFDVSGAAFGPVVLGGAQTKTSLASIASAGGTINMNAREGILFAGTAQGQAGNASQQGGSFKMSLVQSPTPPGEGYPDASISTLNIVDGPVASVLPAGLSAGQPIVGFEDQAWISTGSFSKGGFDTLYFKSQSVINLSSASASFNLNAPAAIYLDAPVLAVSSAAGSTTTLNSATINSAYVKLGSDDFEYQNNPSADVLANVNNNYFSTNSGYQNNAASAGVATLNVNATTIDLTGNTVVQGVSNTNLYAAQDIRLIGVSQLNLASGPSSTVVPTLQQLMPTGEFSVAGNLTLFSSQVYPVTLSSFALDAQGANSTLNFVSNGTKGYSPLSAAGSLFGFAQTINQSGVVEAPFGTIDLVAGNTLTYSSGSTTSVAGTGTIPFGTLLNGRQWVYDFGQGNEVAFSLDPTTSSTIPETTLPQKIIISQAPNVDTNSGATLNLSGGGNLYAYEFTAGSYGSVDVLKNNSATSPTNVFAILPGYTNAVAPFDYQYSQDGGLQPGQSVYLSAIAGLAAGNYVLLPGHYALLPGALAVTVTNTGLDMVAANNVVNLNGTYTVAGRSDVLGLGSTRTNAVTVTPGNVVRLESQYQDYDLTNYFSSAATVAGVTAPELPVDGGQVEFDATSTLSLAGTFLLNASKNGRNGIADISAPVIEVVSDAAQTVEANAVKLVAGDLVSLDADSLLLGGTRQISGTGTNLSVGAQSITIANDSAHALNGPEIILAAQDNITLAAGAAVTASGTLQSTPTKIVIQSTDPSGNTVGTDGALLRVSAGAGVAVLRTAPAGVTGVLTIGQGAVVGATGSAYLDASTDNINNGQLKLSSGAALGIGAPRISLGDSIPTGIDGLLFNTAAITNLSSLSSLEMNSYSTIDLYGNVNLGTSAMKNLVLTSSGFQGNYTAGAAGDVTFTAQNVELKGGNNFVTAGPVNSGSAGTFNVVAQNIEVGNGNIAVKGYAQTNLNASSQLSVAGSGTFSADQNMTLTAGVITGNSASVVAIAAGGDLALNQATGTGAAASATQLGGNVAFSGNTVTSGANINLPSGSVSMTGANGVNITGGTIFAGGASEVFGSTTAYAPAGSITLNAGSGNLVVDAGSTLDVSSVGASAGQLSVAAGQTITLNGVLKGSATPGVNGAAQTQGSFALDAGQLTSATQLDQTAAALGLAGFTQQVSVRLRSGDVTLDGGSTLKASQVSIAADDGSVNIAGTIDASGSAGGSIGLYASQPMSSGTSGNVNLLAGSLLNAQATVAATSTTQSTAGSTGTGGTVMISTGSADGLAPATNSGGSAITFANGATINVSGNSTETNGNANGTVTFRAPQIAGGSDLAITALNGNVVGSKLTGVEGYKVYNAAQISAAPDQQNADGTYANLQAATTKGGVPTNGVMYMDANTFANDGAAAALAARSNPNLNLTVMPGIEVRSTSDLTVSVNESNTIKQYRGWNLDQWHGTGTPIDAPINLTLRAAGNLMINGSISDGFVNPGGSRSNGLSLPDWALDNQISGSFRLTGGADLSAANSLAVIPNANSGDVQINFANTNNSALTNMPVALVRTGTGSIDIAAGRNVVLGTLTNADPNLTQSAAVYTAGMATPYDGSLGSFSAPTNALNTQFGASSKTLSTAQFAEGGGAISIFANQSVIGAPQDQLVNNWLFHQGATSTDANGNTVFATIKGLTLNTAWWAQPDYFDQGIATMAGGNVSIVALNGNLQDVSAGVASSAFMPGASAGALVERGGGNLTVFAGGNINGGSFYVQNGQANINAGGSITSGTLQSNGFAVNPIFALGNAQLNVTARDDLTIEAIYNPTLAAQSMYNIALTNNVTPAINKHPELGNYTTYSDQSAVSFTAVAGDIQMTNNGGLTVSNMGAEAIPIQTLDGILPYDNFYTYTPATVNIASLSGSVNSTFGFSMAGAALGELNILAADSVSLSGSALVMSDVNLANFSPYYAPTNLSQFQTSTDLPVIVPGATYVSNLLAHTEGGLHSGDSDPVRIIALTGDITGDSTLPNTLILPKLTEISAGKDIKDLGFTIQNNAATDITTITAGNNYIDSTKPVSVGSQVQQVIDGPGRIDISAGHNFDLGDSAGIVTRGNLDNQYMSLGGAAINIQAGTTTANYAGFVKNFVTLADLSQTDQNALIAYVASVNPGSANTASAAFAAFQSLPVAQQQSFLNSIKPDLNALFFSDLVANSKISGLTAFDNQIATLFPNINTLGGDINIFASQLKTDQGGSIYLFTPGGSVYAGLPNMPGYLQKSPSDLGVFTISGGAMAALVHSNFEVDQGRVFTLGGGDITLVSQYGDLSAGEGTKTASSAPPPILTTDANGNTVVDISGSIAGSGIATLKTGPDVPDSSVYVVAPRGVFDAGDAGVRSSGSVVINALVVLNAGNIVAAGTVTGVPTIETVNVGAGLSNSATPNVNDITKNITAQNVASSNPETLLTVDVLGFGSDCKDNKDGCEKADDGNKKPGKI